MSVRSKVIAIIPTFNRKLLLKNCIDSLLSQTFSLDQIIVIDSGSTDGTLEMLNNYREKIDLIVGNNAWWWARCMNEGINYSLEKGAEYVLAMNDDTYLEKNALEFLLETTRKTNNAIVGCVVTDSSNTSNVYNCRFGAEYTKYKWLPIKRLLKRINDRDIYYTEGQSGRGVLFPKEVYNKVGLYDDVTFPQHADRDYSLRCLKGNIIQCIDSSAKVYLNFSTTQIGSKDLKLTLSEIMDILFHKKGIYNIKNQFSFLYKHYRLSWFFWFFLWIGYVSVVISIKLIPVGMKIVKKVSIKNASDN